MVAVPLVVAYLVPLFARWRKHWVAPGAFFALFFCCVGSLSLLLKVMRSGPFTYHFGNWPPPFGIEFAVDYLAVFTVLTLSLVGFIVLIYSIDDLRHELRAEVRGWYYTLYLTLLASMFGIAMTNDIFNLFVFIEISAIASCGIISIKESRDCIEAALKYLVLSALGSGCILLAIALLYMVTGHLNMTYLAQAMPQAAELYPYNLLASLALLLVGLGIKAALFPLHVWLPDAHAAAPSPSSAVLSGLVIKIYAVAMIKLLFRVYPAFFLARTPVAEILLWLSTLAILLGSMFAMVQEDLKKMLAYSSIAQIGYVFLGVALMGENALTGGILHIFNHAVMKAMLFLAAGAFIYATGTRRIKDLAGIGQTMPVAGIAFAVGALAMVGIPLTNGFVSKWYLALGALDVGRPFFTAVVLVSSLLNGIYYLPIIINAFFRAPSGNVAAPRALPARMTAAIVVLAAAVIIFGFFPNRMAGIVAHAAQLLLGLR
ncbi:MAG TPA: monovalent cation/H+ antiporter subunit D family protein [Firmicutes bacterium]|nr:monovalent cation/H+ antiporter subunit D family protein [Bacillota bacterium]